MELADAQEFGYQRALELTASTLVQFRHQLAEGVSDEEIERTLSSFLHLSSRTRLLSEVAELVAFAWLEARPANPTVRRAVAGYLVLMGRAEEAIQIEDGGIFPPLTTPEDQIRRLNEQLARSAAALGFDPPP